MRLRNHLMSLAHEPVQSANPKAESAGAAAGTDSACGQVRCDRRVSGQCGSGAPDHELIKIKFAAFKDERKSLAAEIAARTNSEVVWIVGHVAVLYRMQLDPNRRRVLLDE
jgi:hypothetical protein